MNTINLNYDKIARDTERYHWAALGIRDPTPAPTEAWLPEIYTPEVLHSIEVVFKQLCAYRGHTEDFYRSLDADQQLVAALGIIRKRFIIKDASFLERLVKFQMNRWQNKESQS